jgi:hypothetical protein
VKIQIGKLAVGAAPLFATCMLGACQTSMTAGSFGADAGASGGSPELATGGPSHSSAWASVLPASAVNGRALAMSENGADYGRLDYQLGVVTGPPGEPLTYYSTPNAPSLDLLYQFTIGNSPNQVTIFRRPSDVYPYAYPYPYYPGYHLP